MSNGEKVPLPLAYVGNKFVVTKDDEIIPITNYFMIDGTEIDGALLPADQKVIMENCIAIVIGPDKSGFWHTIQQILPVGEPVVTGNTREEVNTVDAASHQDKLDG